MEIRLNKNLYSKMALLKTAYSFTDSSYIHLSQDDQEWIVEWNAKKNGTEIDARQFENELIAQSLREIIGSETKDLRRLVLARAMASTLIDEKIDQEEQCRESNDDAEKILSGWFEQNG